MNFQTIGKQWIRVRMDEWVNEWINERLFQGNTKAI